MKRSFLLLALMAVASLWGTAKASDFNVTVLWDNTVTSTTPCNWTYASTNARCLTAKTDTVFVPVRAGGAATANGVRAINANTGELIKVMDMNAAIVSGGAHIISGTAVTSDGVLLVSNLQTVIDAAAPFKVYAYKSANAEPTVLLNFTDGSGFFKGKRLGDNITYSGSFQKGTLRCYSGTGTLRDRYFEFYVVDGVITNPTAPVTRMLWNTGRVPFAAGGANEYAGGSYARVYDAPDGGVWVKGSGVRPRHFTDSVFDGTVGAALNQNFGNTAKPFSYNGKHYLATVDYTSSNAQATAVILDVTDSKDGVLVYRSKVFGNAANTNGTDGVDVIISGNHVDAFFLSATEGAMAIRLTPVGSVDVTNTLANNIYYTINHNAQEITFNSMVNEVKLYAVSGALIGNYTQVQNISTATLNGIYILAMKAADGSVKTAKVIL